MATAMRLLARLRAHDWTAALIELVIVVLGVLIALEVSNWNQERQDRARAAVYYGRIQEELHADLHNIDLTLAMYAQVQTAMQQAATHGETGQLVEGSPWPTIVAYFRASQVQPIELSDTTFAEMRSTGDLRLIQDPALHKALAEYYRITGGGWVAMILHHDPEFRRDLRGMLPWSVLDYLWSRCFREPSLNETAFVDCPAPISDSEAEAIAARLRASPQLLDELRAWKSTLQVSAIVLANARRDAVRLAETVAPLANGR